MTIRGNRLAIDWSRNGTFTNALEDLTAGGVGNSYVLPGDIEIGWGRDVSGDATLKSTTGSMQFQLNNDTQVFSPENVSSPIAGKILPNRRVVYDITHLSTVYTLLDGELDSYVVSDDIDSVFTGTALDAWGRPGAEKLSTQLYQGIRTGTAIGVVLDAIGWTGARDLDPGATVMPFWWEEGTDASTAIDRIVSSEGTPAIAYVEGGTFVFRDRHHRLLKTRSQTSQGTFSHIYPQTNFLGSDFKIEKDTFHYNHGAFNIVNTVTFSIDQRFPSPGGGGEFWFSDDPIPITSGVTLQIAIQTSDPFFAAAAPAIGSSNLVLQSGSVSSTSISRTSGQSLILSITASSDTVIAHVGVTGTTVPVVRTVQVSARDGGSVGNFGQEEWTAGAPVWANVYDAQVIANKIVSVYASYQPTITFTVVSLSDAYLTKMLSLKISDRITVRNDKRGINGDFMIERLSYKISRLGVWYRVTITCRPTEPVQPATAFTFNVAGRGFNDGRFGVEGVDDFATMFIFDTAGKGFNDGRFSN